MHSGTHFAHRHTYTGTGMGLRRWSRARWLRRRRTELIMEGETKKVISFHRVPTELRREYATYAHVVDKRTHCMQILLTFDNAQKFDYYNLSRCNFISNPSWKFHGLFVWQTKGNFIPSSSSLFVNILWTYNTRQRTMAILQRKRASALACKVPPGVIRSKISEKFRLLLSRCKKRNLWTVLCLTERISPL